MGDHTYYLEGRMPSWELAQRYHLDEIQQRFSQAQHQDIGKLEIGVFDMLRVLDTIKREQDDHADTRARLCAINHELQNIAIANERLRGKIAYYEAENAGLRRQLEQTRKWSKAWKGSAKLYREIAGEFNVGLRIANDEATEAGLEAVIFGDDAETIHWVNRRAEKAESELRELRARLAALERRP